MFLSIHLLRQINKAYYELQELCVLAEDRLWLPAVPVILIIFISHEVDSPLSVFFMTTNYFLITVSHCNFRATASSNIDPF